MERSASHLAAQEVYGRRMLVASVCRHRQGCGIVAEHQGRRVHIDGLTFADDEAAGRFDRARLCRPWMVFASWDAARAWLLA